MSTGDRLGALVQKYATEEAAQAAAEAADLARRNMRDICAVCQSPIEGLLLAGLAARGWLDFHGNVAASGCVPHATKLKAGQAFGVLLSSPDAAFSWCSLLALQYSLRLRGRKFVLDFAIFVRWLPTETATERFGQIAVECDGHDYHERTKQQAAADRSRDRILIEHGWTPVRFTGAELHADAEACADQLMHLVLCAKQVEA